MVTSNVDKKSQELGSFIHTQLVPNIPVDVWARTVNIIRVQVESYYNQNCSVDISMGKENIGNITTFKVDNQITFSVTLQDVVIQEVGYYFEIVHQILYELHSNDVGGISLFSDILEILQLLGSDYGYSTMRYVNNSVLMKSFILCGPIEPVKLMIQQTSDSICD